MGHRVIEAHAATEGCAMTRLLIASTLILGVTSLAQASSPPLAVNFGGAQIVELKCKAGFKPNRRKTRCVAVARPSTISDDSGGGGGDGGNSGGGSH
jgi:hypothetical protein